MTTYYTSIEAMDLTATDADVRAFEEVSARIPEDRRAEAMRAFMIATVAGRTYHCSVRWEALGGKSDAEILETVNATVTRHMARNGVRALKDKYGEEAAARIVKAKSGRTIR